MTTLPSFSLPGLEWHATPQPEDSPLWHAVWDNTPYGSRDALHSVLGTVGDTDAVRFETWLGFGLGFDGFNPIINPDHWTALLNRGPVDIDTGAQDGVPLAQAYRRAPHQGKHGLEGLIIHPHTGHVLRALAEGIKGLENLGVPTQSSTLPLLIPLTVVPNDDAPKASS